MSIVIANWKMNQTIKSVENFADKLNNFLKNINLNIELIICPPYTLIDRARDLFDPRIKIGAQDCSAISEVYGSFTGEISAKMLKELGCEYVIIGHQERRINQQENPLLIKNKITNAHLNNLKVIICLSNLENSANQVTKQLLMNLPITSNSNNVLIAYEPADSIGTNQLASNERLIEIFSLIIESFTNKSISFENIPKLLYGGSVKLNNVDVLLNNIKMIDGLLIGKSSLDQEEFIAIIDNINSRYK